MASKVKIMSASDLILHKKAILGEHPSSFRHDGYGKFVKAEGR